MKTNNFIVFVIQKQSQFGTYKKLYDSGSCTSNKSNFNHLVPQ